MHVPQIIGTVTVCPYRDVPFCDYTGIIDKFDKHIDLDIPQNLIRLIQSGLVRIILFSGITQRDIHVWLQMQGTDNFSTFISDIQHRTEPTIILAPECKIAPLRTLFREQQIALNEYGPKNRLMHRFCRIGIYEDHEAISCTVLTHPYCNN